MNKTIIFVITIIIVLSSCKNVISHNVEQKKVNRTVIVYMVAENTLDPFSLKDINEMELGWNNELDGNLLVYIDRPSTATTPHPCLFRILHDDDDRIVSPIVKMYEELDSTREESLNMVLTDTISNYPAESYGLIFWSHGSGWLPPISAVENSLEPSRSFGLDNGEEMELKSLSSALPIKFDFIIFDACYMGSVEVAYEIKDKTEYILFSSSEILSDGYPYDNITPELFQPILNYSAIATYFYDFYNNASDNYKRSATISVIKTDELSALADKTRSIIYTSPEIFDIDNSEIQEFVISADYSGLFFDFGHIIELAKDKSIISEAIYNDFFNQLNQTVIYKANTATFFDILNITHFSGLSIYFFDKEKTEYNYYYTTLDWYKESGYEKIFFTN